MRDPKRKNISFLFPPWLVKHAKNARRTIPRSSTEETFTNYRGCPRARRRGSLLVREQFALALSFIAAKVRQNTGRVADDARRASAIEEVRGNSPLLPLTPTHLSCIMAFFFFFFSPSLPSTPRHLHSRRRGTRLSLYRVEEGVQALV